MTPGVTAGVALPSLSTFSQNALVHLSWALSAYQQQAERNGLAIPAELVRLMVAVSAGAMSGQGSPLLAEPLQSAQAGPVTTNLLTRAQAAEALGCSERTVSRRVRDGSLPTRQLGRLVRIDLGEYLAHTNEGATT